MEALELRLDAAAAQHGLSLVHISPLGELFRGLRQECSLGRLQAGAVRGKLVEPNVGRLVVRQDGKTVACCFFQDQDTPGLASIIFSLVKPIHSCSLPILGFEMGSSDAPPASRHLLAPAQSRADDTAAQFCLPPAAKLVPVPVEPRPDRENARARDPIEIVAPKTRSLNEDWRKGRATLFPGWETETWSWPTFLRCPAVPISSVMLSTISASKLRAAQLRHPLRAPRLVELWLVTLRSGVMMP